jgi:hypothetical protein
MADYTITFTTVDDVRFPGRCILIGEVGGMRFYAAFHKRRQHAEDAIRKAFSEAYAAAGSGN